MYLQMYEKFLKNGQKEIHFLLNGLDFPYLTNFMHLFSTHLIDIL